MEIRDGAGWRWGEDIDRDEYMDEEEDGSVVEGGEKEENEKEAEGKEAGSDHMHLGFSFHLDFPREKI
jgi:hypothetical protein